MSIALTFLYDNRIKWQYPSGDRRRFTRCGQFPSLTCSLHGLCEVIGAGVENPVDQTPHHYPYPQTR